MTAAGSAGRVRPATVRFYIDADVLGLAKLLVRVRNDVTYPGDPGGTLHKRERPPFPVSSPKALDTEWIPEVAAARGWLIISRDANIGVNPYGRVGFKSPVTAPSVQRYGAKSSSGGRVDERPGLVDQSFDAGR